MVLGLCDRFHCLPSQLYKEDVEILRMVKIQTLGTKQEGGDMPGEPNG